MIDTPSKIIPNTFQCPNALIDDEIMALLSGNEMKCYLVVVRKTYGWHKAADRIAKAQIMELAGLGETACDASMTVLVELGLVLRLAENNPTTNQGVLWGLQTDDQQIRWDKLRARRDAVSAKKSKVMERARAVRRGGVDDQPQVDEQPQGRVDGQGEGGVDHQATQKPLSKATIKKEEEEPKPQEFEFSLALQKALTNAGIFRVCWPDVASRLASGGTEDDIFALLAWMSYAGGKPGRFVTRVRDGTKAPAKYYPVLEDSGDPAVEDAPEAEQEPLPPRQPEWWAGMIELVFPYLETSRPLRAALLNANVEVDPAGDPDEFTTVRVLTDFLELDTLQDRTGRTLLNALRGYLGRNVTLSFVSAETEPA